MWSAKPSRDLDEWSAIRTVSTGPRMSESTCEDIYEKDGVPWRGVGVDARPLVSVLDNGRLWIEWEGSGYAYDLDQEEAEWLSRKLMDFVKKPAGREQQDREAERWLGLRD